MDELKAIEREAAAMAELAEIAVRTPTGSSACVTALHLLRAWRTAERAAKIALTALTEASERERAMQAAYDAALADITAAAQAHDARVAELEAIIAGRTTPPTTDEAVSP